MAKNKSRSLYSAVGFRLLLVTTLTALSVYGLKTFTQSSTNNNVLGTSVFIADKGSDSGGSSGGGTSDGQSGSGSNSISDSQNTSGSINNSVPPPTTKPTEVEHKSEPVERPEAKTPEPTKIPEFNTESLNNVEFQTQKGRASLNLEQQNSKLEISNEDGKLSIKAKDENGTETQLHQEDSLEKINEALKDEDIEVGTGSGNLLTIRKGQFEAETHFPLTINPTTNSLTVTTPAGEKTVAVLPDQAVNNLINQKFIDQVASTSAGTGIVLGLLNNQPAFQIQGTDAKKLLGFLPVDISKTSYVSAENGSVLKTNESIINSILDLLSVQ